MTLSPSVPLPHIPALSAHRALADRYTDILRRYTAQGIVTAAVIASVDGVEIASVLSEPDLRPAGLAAMASSLVAVAIATGREVGHDTCERLFIETSCGTLLVKPVGRAGELVLCMALAPRIVLAKGFWAADEICRALAAC